MMLRTIRHPNNMYAGNNYGGKFTFFEINLKLYLFPERKGSTDNDYPHPPSPPRHQHLETTPGRLFLFLSDQPTIK